MKLTTVLLALCSGVAIAAGADGFTTVSTAPSVSSSGACKPTPLRNGNFESGRIAPWKASGEGESKADAFAITTQAHTGKYALDFSINYTINHALYPNAYLLQYVNGCGKPQVLTLWYNVVSTASDTDTFNVQVYDSYSHHVFVLHTVSFNDSSTYDSRGKPNGQWHKLGPYKFTPYEDKVIFTLFLQGSGNGGTGYASMLLDDVLLVAQ